MSSDKTRRVADHYVETLQKLEKQAEQQAPGVLDLLDAYGHLVGAPTPWTPINASSVSYATDANPGR
jgi:hypothetical protein